MRATNSTTIPLPPATLPPRIPAGTPSPPGEPTRTINLNPTYAMGDRRGPIGTSKSRKPRGKGSLADLSRLWAFLVVTLAAVILYIAPGCDPSDKSRHVPSRFSKASPLSELVDGSPTLRLGGARLSRTCWPTTSMRGPARGDIVVSHVASAIPSTTYVKRIVGPAGREGADEGRHPAYRAGGRLPTVGMRAPTHKLVTSGTAGTSRFPPQRRRRDAAQRA